MRHMQQTLMVIGPDHATSDLYKLKGLRCKWVVCGYGLRVANLPDEVWESVPGKVMKRLLQLKTKIMEGWVWAAVADEFVSLAQPIPSFSSQLIAVSCSCLATSRADL